MRPRGTKKFEFLVFLVVTGILVAEGGGGPSVRGCVSGGDEESRVVRTNEGQKYPGGGRDEGVLGKERGNLVSSETY